MKLIRYFSKQFHCPLCLEKLTVTGQKRLHTMIEEGFDPNGVPPLRDVYQCATSGCVAREYDWMWDVFGDVYYAGMRVSLNPLFGQYQAVGSFAWRHEFRTKMERAFTFKLHWRGRRYDVSVLTRQIKVWKAKEEFGETVYFWEKTYQRMRNLEGRRIAA